MRISCKIFTTKWLMSVLLLISTAGFSQVTISGPDCVMPGLQYQYIINTGEQVPSSLQICITGGTLVSGGHCTSPDSLSLMVLVHWKDSIGHKVDVASSLGHFSLPVQVTKELKGGKLDSSDKSQSYTGDTVSYRFRCEPASGGSCEPNYYYLWQKSDDAINWDNLEGANEKDLVFTGGIIRNTFFRRVVTDTHSGIMTYSETAQLTIHFE